MERSFSLHFGHVNLGEPFQPQLQTVTRHCCLKDRTDSVGWSKQGGVLSKDLGVFCGGAWCFTSALSIAMLFPLLSLQTGEGTLLLRPEPKPPKSKSSYMESRDYELSAVLSRCQLHKGVERGKAT